MISRKCLFQKGDEWIDAMCETRSKCEGQDVNGESEYIVVVHSEFRVRLSLSVICRMAIW